MPKYLKRDPLRFFIIRSVAFGIFAKTSNKEEGGPFVDIKISFINGKKSLQKVRKKTKMRILNSLIVPKILKKGPFGIF